VGNEAQNLYTQLVEMSDELTTNIGIECYPSSWKEWTPSIAKVVNRGLFFRPSRNAGRRIGSTNLPRKGAEDPVPTGWGRRTTRSRAS
jgi:hypothetical protein